MRVERHDGTRARKVLVGMVVSKDVLARLAPLWDGELFPSPWENLVAGWCVDHFVRYASAPKADIAARFEAWSESADKATKDLVGRFLQELDGEYRRLAKSVNAEYLVDLAGDLFNRTRLERTLDKAKADLAAGDVRKAQARLLKQTPVEVGAGSVIDVLSSDALVSQTFTAKQAPLFTYPDAAGVFFNQSLERDGFLAVMAPSKSGKTFWLMDFAWTAMEQRRRVLFFQCGDLSATQMTKRFLERAARHPMQAESWPHVTRYPRKVSNHGDGGLEIEWKEKTFTGPLTEADGKEAFRLVQSEVLRSDESYLKMSVHANSSLTTAGIRSIVQAYDAQGWTPDCVVEGSLVLTEKRGLVPIEKVRCSDRLWDGESWVDHHGPIYKGVRDVITYQGITATPDHQVWTEDGWRTLVTCRDLGLRIARTENQGRAIRLSRGLLTDGSGEVGREGKKEVCVCSVCQVQGREVGDVRQHSERNCQGVSELSPAKTVSEMAVLSNGGHEVPVYQSEDRCLPQIRRTWYPVSISFGGGRLPLGNGELFPGRGSCKGVRSEGQRWTLRTRQYPAVHEEAKYEPYQKAEMDGYGSSVSSTSSVCDLCGCYLGRSVCQRVYPRPDCHSVEDTYGQKKARVWDILNSGPFHRFTVQGLLVHNCVIVDYADILANPPGYSESRDAVNHNWKDLRRLSQEYHCLVVTGTQTNAASFDTELLSRKHFSEDRRKFDHVTGMFGLNVGKDDRRQQLTKVNWVIPPRERDWKDQVLYAVACLDYAMPCVRSTF